MGIEKKIDDLPVELIMPTGRGEGLGTGLHWMKGKRADDGAEGIWRIGDKLYNFKDWIDRHPGGEEWLRITKGTDITEAFEAHHVSLAAERLLPKFYVRDAVGPRTCLYTFKPDGFYRTLKDRVREALKDVDYIKPSWTTNLIIDTLFVATVACCLTAAATRSWLAIIASGICLTWTAIAAHNYIHKKDAFRMYYLDLTLMSSLEWRITHALSHHLYPNTLLDNEMTMWEPVFQWLPERQKGLITRYGPWVWFTAIWPITYFGAGFKRYFCILFQSARPGIRDLVPFLLPALMCLVAPPSSVITTWLKIIVVASLHFSVVGLNAAHHHPDIYHAGDVRRADMDWGLAQLDAVRDRIEVQKAYFFVLTMYGSHSLHHLFPTVDHKYLYLCEPAFYQTCKEFGVDTEFWPQWELVKGHFLQMARNEPTDTANGR